MLTYRWFGSWSCRVHATLPGRTALGCLRTNATIFRHAVAWTQFRYQGHAARHHAVLRSAALELKDQLPILQTAKVREFRGGIPTMTADGHHILGPASGATGFYFGSGCNVAGFSISPTIGEALATWIIDGRPAVDLSPMSVTRFKDQSWSEPQLKREAAWQYRHFYGAASAPAGDSGKLWFDEPRRMTAMGHGRRSR